nr:endonuclease/exonuclease/phosphatase family protein [Algoriphagus terrigena]
MLLRPILFLILSSISSFYQLGSEEKPTTTSPRGEDDKKAINLTILSYNVRHCSPPANPSLIDVEAIANIIKDSKAELVGLQEIDVNNGRSGVNLDQAAKLGELTGMYHYFSKGIDYQGGAYGTAILSKFPLSEQETIQLPEAPDTEQRTLSLVTATLPDGRKIRFANTHLDFTADENALAQAKVITEKLKDERLPVFVVGDFNVVKESQTMQHLNQYFTSTCETNCMPTIPADVPKKTLDFILFSNNQDITVRAHEVLNRPTASNHRPVWARVSLK